MDISIDSRGGQVTVRSTGKDGKEEVKTDHLSLPPDLANGMVPLVVENMRPDAPETKVSLLVATPKPRLVTLVISSRGEETFSVVGAPRKAIHYEIKIELGGVAGVVAPLMGKEPPNIQLWIIGGQAPTFIREQGPIYPEGPIMTIQLASPVWPESPKSGCFFDYKCANFRFSQQRASPQITVPIFVPTLRQIWSQFRLYG